MTATEKAVVPFVQQVEDALYSREEQLVALLGQSIPFERWATVALHGINTNRDLWKCSLASVIEALRDSAALHLEPTGLLGDAYLVRYGDKARLMPGYRGLMKLARRTGEVDSIDAHVVYERDEFQIRLGSESTVIHVPQLNERGGFLGAYAYARLRTGELVVEWMGNADMEKIRRSSKASNDGPWVTWPEEMYRKSAIRRLMKRLPLTTEAQRALALESEAEGDGRETLPRPPDRSARLRANLRRRLNHEGSDDQEASAEAPQAEEATVQEESGAGAAESEAAAVEAVCGASSPYEPPAPCTREAGHGGYHKAGTQETWA